MKFFEPRTPRLDSPEALVCCRVVSRVLSGVVSGHVHAGAVAHAAAIGWWTDSSAPRRRSLGTLNRWFRACEADRAVDLEPASRIRSESP